MTATIAYDRPVRNLIDGLTATGHLGESGMPKHQTFRKTMVTMHHNGGVGFSHQDILNIWKTREASAHFDVDPAGEVAQYVAAGEYAWSCASRVGNETSISIELANSSGSPGWLVSDTTWKAGCRLAGWLFAHVIKARPTSSNLVYHHHWYATACAGPYMDSIYARVLAETQAAYDAFVNGTPTAPTQEEELMALTVKNPVTGEAWPLDRALWSVWTYSINAAHDAAEALAVSKALAAKGSALSEAEIAAIGVAVGDKLAAGFEVDLKPKAV